MNEAPPSSGTNRLLTASVILFSLIVLLQLGLLLQRQLNQKAVSASEETGTAATVPPPALSRGSAVSFSEDPFEHMRRMQRQIDAMFAGALNELSRPPRGFDEGWSRLEVTPGFSVRQTDTTYEVTVHLPGVDKADIQIALDESVLSLVVNQTSRSATKTAEGTTLLESQRASRFERHLRLPEATGNQEDIRAVFEQGVLRIIVPKVRKDEAKPKSIPVR
jgi:HSP20 family protein